MVDLGEVGNKSMDVFSLWCEPIVAALWERNQIKINAAVSAAKRILSSGALFDDEKEVLESNLIYFEFQASVVCDKGKEGVKNGYPFWLKQLEVISQYKQVNQLRAGLLLQLCIFLDRNGLITLDQKKFNDIEQRIGDKGFNSQTWYYVAVWAYKYGYTDVLESAFSHFFDRVNANEFYNEWSYHLTKLMYNLKSNCANKAELQQIIGLAQDPTQLKVFHCVVWHDAKAASLIDDEVSQAYENRKAKLQSTSESYRSVSRINRFNTPVVTSQTSR